MSAQPLDMPRLPGAGRAALGAGALYGPLAGGRPATPEAARDAFEGLLLGEMLKPLEQSLRESGFFPKGAPGDIYAHFWKTHLSQLLADAVELAPGDETASGPRPIRELEDRDFVSGARHALPPASSAVPASGPSGTEGVRAAPEALALPPGATEAPAHLRPVLTRLGSLDGIVRTAAREAGISANWVRAVITQESGARAEAESSRGAQGLMQLMPATARALGVADSLDPHQNVRGGTRYLSSLMRRFASPELALAAYNAGPSRVEDFGGVPPFRETQDYVRKVVAFKGLYDRLYPAD